MGWWTHSPALIDFFVFFCIMNNCIDILTTHKKPTILLFKMLNPLLFLLYNTFLFGLSGWKQTKKWKGPSNTNLYTFNTVREPHEDPCLRNNKPRIRELLEVYLLTTSNSVDHKGMEQNKVPPKWCICSFLN